MVQVSGNDDSLVYGERCCFHQWIIRFILEWEKHFMGMVNIMNQSRNEVTHNVEVLGHPLSVAVVVIISIFVRFRSFWKCKNIFDPFLVINWEVILFWVFVVSFWGGYDKNFGRSRGPKMECWITRYQEWNLIGQHQNFDNRDLSTANTCPHPRLVLIPWGKNCGWLVIYFECHWPPKRKQWEMKKMR